MTTSFDEAIKAIQNCYDDQRFSLEESIENMRSLKEEIDIYIEALLEDQENQSEE